MYNEQNWLNNYCIDLNGNKGRNAQLILGRILGPRVLTNQLLKIVIHIISIFYMKIYKECQQYF